MEKKWFIKYSRKLRISLTDLHDVLNYMWAPYFEKMIYYMDDKTLILQVNVHVEFDVYCNMLMHEH